MHNPLPKINYHEEYSHVKFDEIFASFKPVYPQDGLQVKFLVDGNTNGSDIKINNFSGRVRLAVLRNGQEHASLFGCQVDCFTGNCGVKAIDHLWFQSPIKVTDRVERNKEMLKILESFLYHRCNAGLVVGSDTSTTDYTGPTLANVTELGTGYQVGERIWNPNYTWRKDHTISLFYKDLTVGSHDNYWGGS